jgi:hypothetical protein
MTNHISDASHFLRCDACGSEMWDNPNRVNTRCLRKPKGKDCRGKLRRHEICASQSDRGAE